MHGGRLLTVADETAFMSAQRHSGGICLTRAVHQAVFHSPARPGETLLFSSVVAHTGRSSLWIPVWVHASAAPDQLIMEAVFVFTALDEQGRPRQIDAVLASSDEEQDLQRRIERLRLDRLG